MTTDKLLAELTRCRVELAAAKLELGRATKPADFRGRPITPEANLPDPTPAPKLASVG